MWIGHETWLLVDVHEFSISIIDPSPSLPVVAIRIVHQTDQTGQTDLVDNNDRESENDLLQYNF